MLIEKNPAVIPENYYEIQDPAQRRKYLTDKLSENADSADEKRLDLLNRRFRRDRDDLFMEAWLLIFMSQQDHLSRFNRKRKEKEFRAYANQLMITEHPDEFLLDEWRDFANKWIQTCLTKQYRSAAFGVITVSDNVLAGKIANEINAVTRDIPARFSCEKAFLPFRRVMTETYRKTIEDSDFRF